VIQISPPLSQYVQDKDPSSESEHGFELSAFESQLETASKMTFEQSIDMDPSSNPQKLQDEHCKLFCVASQVQSKSVVASPGQLLMTQVLPSMLQKRHDTEPSDSSSQIGGIWSAAFVDSISGILSDNGVAGWGSQSNTYEGETLEQSMAIDQSPFPHTSHELHSTEKSATSQVHSDSSE